MAASAPLDLEGGRATLSVRWKAIHVGSLSQPFAHGLCSPTIFTTFPFNFLFPPPYQIFQPFSLLPRLLFLRSSPQSPSFRSIPCKYSPSQMHFSSSLPLSQTSVDVLFWWLTTISCVARTLVLLQQQFSHQSYQSASWPSNHPSTWEEERRLHQGMDGIRGNIE